MIALWIISALALIVSVVADRKKTLTALIKGAAMFWRMAPLLLGVLAAVSLILAAVTPGTLQRILAGSGPGSFIAALIIGAVALIPGFVAYPIAGLARQHGAPVGVLAAFVTSLMMVGVLTLPMEARYLGWRSALLRNALALGGAVVIALGMTWVLA